MKIQVAILRAEKIKSTSGVSRVVCRDRAVICFLINEFNANKVTGLWAPLASAGAVEKTQVTTTKQ